MKDNLLRVDKPQTHIIAYLDMLGTSSKIDKDDDYQKLRRIYTIYMSAFHIIQKFSSVKFHFEKIKIKIFSDNIILAIPLNPNNDIADILLLIRFAAFFQSISSLRHCWPVRGGITIGELFIDEVMVWGKGLTRAYDLENKIAIFPRIVVDKKVVCMIEKDNNYVRSDADGWFFVDFLNFTHSQDNQGNDSIAALIKDSFSKQLEEIKNQSGIHKERAYQKLQWYKNYLNQWYNEHYTSEEDTVLIEESALEENIEKPEKGSS